MRKSSREGVQKPAPAQAIGTAEPSGRGDVQASQRSQGDDLLQFFRAMTVTLGVLGCWALTADGPAAPLVLGGILFLCFRMIVLAADRARGRVRDPGDPGVLPRDAFSPAAEASAIPPPNGEGGALIPGARGRRREARSDPA
jgi:hypothetical protein